MSAKHNGGVMGFGVAVAPRKSLRGPCLMKEVAGWTTAIAGGAAH